MSWRREHESCSYARSTRSAVVRFVELRKGRNFFGPVRVDVRAIRGMCGGQNTEGSVTTGPTLRRWAAAVRGGRGVVTSTYIRCRLLRNTPVKLLQRGTCVYCLRYLVRPERISGHHQLTSMPRRSGAPLRLLATGSKFTSWQPLTRLFLPSRCQDLTTVPQGYRRPQPPNNVIHGFVCCFMS